MPIRRGNWALLYLAICWNRGLQARNLFAKRFLHFVLQRKNFRADLQVQNDKMKVFRKRRWNGAKFLNSSFCALSKNSFIDLLVCVSESIFSKIEFSEKINL